MMSGSVDLHWPDALNKGLSPLKAYCKDPNMLANKESIITLARDAAKQPRNTLFALSAPYLFEPTHYFDLNLRTRDSDHRWASGPYTYEYTREVTSFWVDFADLKLGGGVFGDGFLQEEKMCCEIPELANAAGLRWFRPTEEDALYTRDPNNPKVPTPLVLRDARRTFDFSQARVEDITKKYSPDVIAKGKIANPSPVNVLAMSVPRADSKSVVDQRRQQLIDDLLNTFVAGFALARDAAGPEQALVNSGPIGTGDFNNNVYLVYVLQVLAARHVGVDINLYDYGSTYVEADKQLLNIDKQIGGKPVPIRKVLDWVHELDIKPNP